MLHFEAGFIKVLKLTWLLLSFKGYLALFDRSLAVCWFVVGCWFPIAIISLSRTDSVSEIIELHRESEKNRTPGHMMMFRHNFGKCEPVYKILSPEDS